MEEKTTKTRRLRWTIGLMMAFVAVSAVLFSLVRPPDHRATVRQALEVMAINQASLDSTQYRVDSVTPSSDRHYWQVVFSPLPGKKGRKMTVVVPDRVDPPIVFSPLPEP